MADFGLNTLLDPFGRKKKPKTKPKVNKNPNDPSKQSVVFKAPKPQNPLVQQQPVSPAPAVKKPAPKPAPARRPPRAVNAPLAESPDIPEPGDTVAQRKAAAKALAVQRAIAAGKSTARKDIKKKTTAPPPPGTTAPGTTAPGTTAPGTTAPDSIGALYAPAQRELQRQRDALAARQAREMIDQKAFADWQDTRRTESQRRFDDANRAANDASAAVRQKTRDDARAYIASAVGKLNPEIAAAAGVGDAQAMNLAQQVGTDSDSSSALNASAADSNYVTSVGDSDRARAANMLAAAQDRGAAGTAQVDAASNDLSKQVASARLTQSNEDRNFGLQKQAADWLVNYQKQGLKLQKDQMAAEVKIAKNKAQADAYAAELNARVKAKELSLKEARLMLDQSTAAWRADDKNAQRTFDQWKVRFNASASAASKREARSTNATKFMTGQLDAISGRLYPGKTWNTLDFGAGEERQVVRNAVETLAASYPGISQAEAVKVLRATLGANRVTDAEILKQITSSWKK